MSYSGARPIGFQSEFLTITRGTGLMSLEYAVEFTDDDELVTITPKSLCLHKRHLVEHERKKAAKETAI